MKEWLRDNWYALFVIIFYVVELVTVSVVLWETFTGKSVVDVLFDKFGKD